MVAALVVFARRVGSSSRPRASIAIHSAFGTQILLGIATVLTGMNIVLAVLHQAVGALLVARDGLGRACRSDGERSDERRHRLRVFADEPPRRRIGRTMVEERLAACVNILAAVPLDLPLAGAIETAARSRPCSRRRSTRPTR